MKRRWCCVFLAFLLCALSVTGCKKNVGTPEDNAIVEEDPETEEAKTYKFGFSCITMSNPYFIKLEESLRLTLEENGHTLIVEDPANDAEEQNRQIQEMIAKGIDAIFLCPVDWEAISPSLDALIDADVKIINVDTQVKELDKVDAYIGSDNRQAGMICGENLIEKKPEGGKVLILECPTMNSINDRISGFEEVIAEKGFEVVARRDTHGDLKESINAAEEELKKYPEVIAIMCGNDEMAQGALVAANSLGMSDVLIYGVDGSPDLKKELKKKETMIAGTAAQSPVTMGRDAAKIGMAILNGDKYEKETYEEVFFVNAENVEVYGAEDWQ